LNPGRRGGKQATNRLSYGAACNFTLLNKYTDYLALNEMMPGIVVEIRTKYLRNENELFVSWVKKRNACGSWKSNH
jgi:hypothetical protein